MDTFLKSAAAALIAMILCLVLSKQGKDFSAILSILACCMITIAAINYLQPVIDLVYELQTLGKLDENMLRIILKAVGIGIIGEITGLICVDAGNAAMGKTLQTLASAVILWMSVPLFQGLLELIQEILVSL